MTERPAPATVPQEGAADLFAALLERFGALGGVELPLPPRGEVARAAVLPD